MHSTPVRASRTAAVGIGHPAFARLDEALRSLIAAGQASPVPEHRRQGRFPVPLHGGHARLAAPLTVLGATCSPLPLQARHAACPVPLQMEHFVAVGTLAGFGMDDFENTPTSARPS